MSEATEVAIVLGANLGDPQATLASARRALSDHVAITVLRCSGLYASHPQGPQDQPDYMNQAVLITSELSAHALLDVLQTIETDHGRVRDGAGEHWGPRTLDIDIITYGDQQFDDARLTIPHPRAHERSFVLEPLAEIAPMLDIPGHGTVGILCAQADDGLVYRRPE